MVDASKLDIINLKFLLLCFKAMFGLKIKFEKTKVVVMDYPHEEQQRTAENLNCKLFLFPISYLGIPITDMRILMQGFNLVVVRVKVKAEPLSGRFTSNGRKIMLIFLASPCI